LWWLVLTAGPVKWHRQFELPVKAVVPHVQDESFAVLMDASNGTSMVEIHRVVLGSPHQSHTLPFGLRNVIWYPSHNQADGFSLVGITQSWAVVVCGDGLSTRVEEGATAQDIGTIGVQSSRTVFQDIFGPTAFVDLEARAQSSTSTLDGADHALVASSNIASLFDKQAYLMPPIESMFDSILDSFLQTRISEPLVMLEDEAGEQDEDIEMDVVDETPILSDPRQHRVVGEDEMNQFIDIFRRHAVGG
jgi:NET1-associated nuclear protein 1 (U3 small nucleolar RNA-associated protein 17)